jgi:hypothetical protein
VSSINQISTDTEGRKINFALHEVKNFSDDKLNNVN